MQSQQALAFIQTILTSEQIVLSDIQIAVFCACWQRQSYAQIASELGYDSDYIKQVGAQLWKTLSRSLGTKISKKNIQSVITSLHQDKESLNSTSPSPVTACDWGTSGAQSNVWGRDNELVQLQQSILIEHCTLIAILGNGGVGKTSFAIKVAQQIQSEFHFVIWRTVRDSPSPTDFLGDLLQFLTKDQDLPLPTQLNEQVSLFIELSQVSRCLIVIDNFESLLVASQGCGQYRSESIGYETLLNRISESHHQSCVIITSREMPDNIAVLSGEVLPVRQLILSGLESDSVKKLLAQKNLLGNDSEILHLTQRLSGNPLAIKLASSSIQDIFAGYISRFLEQDSLAFNGIKLLIAQQIDRLSPLELQVMIWLAINRDVMTMSDLEVDLLEIESKAKLLETLESLSRRYLIEKVDFSQRSSSPPGFTLQPVVMEYVTDQCLNEFSNEILMGQFNGLRQYALCKPFGKAYIYKAQTLTFIRPLLKRTSVHFSTVSELINHLKTLLASQQNHSPLHVGYSAGNLINLLLRLQDSFQDLDLSALSIKNADFRGIKLHGANLAQSDVTSCRFSENLGSIFSLAYSPDGRLLAFGDNTLIKLYRVSDYRLKLTLNGHQDPPIWAIAFLDHGLLASSSGDRSIKIWNLETGDCRKTLHPDQGMVYKIAFCPHTEASPPSSPRFASLGSDGTVKLWNLDQGDCLKTLADVDRNPLSIAFNPTGEVLAIGYANGSVCLLNLRNDVKSWLKTSIPSSELPLFFHPQRPILSAGYGDGTIRFWDIEQHTCLSIIQAHQTLVKTLAYNPDGTRLASGSVSQSIRIWDSEQGRCLQTLQEFVGRVSALAFHPRTARLASGSENGVVKIWDTHRGQMLTALLGYNCRIWSVAHHPSKPLIASGSEDTTLTLWDTNTGISQRVLDDHTGKVVSVAFSADGQTLVSASYNYIIKVWNSHTGDCLKTFSKSGLWCWAIEISPSGQYLASSGGEGTVYLWNLQTGEPIREFVGHNSYSVGLAFHPNSSMIAASSHIDQTVKLWNVHTGDCIRTFTEREWVWSVAFHPTEECLVFGTNDGRITIWDIHSGALIQSLQTHLGPVLSLEISHDGQKIATGSGDCTVKIWQYPSGQLLQTLTGHQGIVFSVAFSPDDSILASGSHDESIRTWDTHSGECIHTMKPRRLYEDMNISKTSGLTAAQIVNLKELGAHEANP